MDYFLNKDMNMELSTYNKTKESKLCLITNDKTNIYNISKVVSNKLVSHSSR